MCSNLTLLDGTELSSVGELIERGIMDATDYDATPRWQGHDPLNECLCSIDLETVLAGHASVWKPTSPWGWEQYDAEGRSYWKDGFIEDPSKPRDGERVVYMIPDPDYPYGATETPT